MSLHFLQEQDFLYKPPQLTLVPEVKLQLLLDKTPHMRHHIHTMRIVSQNWLSANNHLHPMVWCTVRLMVYMIGQTINNREYQCGDTDHWCSFQMWERVRVNCITYSFFLNNIMSANHSKKWFSLLANMMNNINITQYLFYMSSLDHLKNPSKEDIVCLSNYECDLFNNAMHRNGQRYWSRHILLMMVLHTWMKQYYLQTDSTTMLVINY